MNFTYTKQSNKTIKSGKPENIFLYWREFVRNQKNIIIVFLEKDSTKKNLLSIWGKKRPTDGTFHVNKQQTAIPN